MSHVSIRKEDFLESPNFGKENPLMKKKTVRLDLNLNQLDEDQDFKPPGKPPGLAKRGL